MSYTRLAVTPSGPAQRDAVSAALFAAGAEGLLEEGLALVTVFDDEAVAHAAERAARTADAGAHTSCTSLEVGDWTEAWRRGVGAHVVGRLVIAPPWLAEQYEAAHTIVVDPGMGFGTGEHETTRSALLLLQDVVRAGDVVADAGCGSGVLAIAAARLGASRVAAIELDPLAITNAEENVERNGVRATVSVVEGDAGVLLPLLAPVRVIVANIISSVLLELLPVFGHALAAGGDVIVSGILVSERHEFVAGAEARAWRVVREQREGEWWTAHMRRKHE